MALSVYDVGQWQPNTTYNIYDIYRYNGFYYTAIRKHNSGGSFNPDYSNGVISYNGTNKPYFFWLCSYNAETPTKPTLKITQFGDGYKQSSPENINSILLNFNLTFDKRTDAETRSILHFLHARKGSESFCYTPPFPYNLISLFKCEQWSTTTIFANNHTVTATFLQSPT